MLLGRVEFHTADNHYDTDREPFARHHRSPARVLRQAPAPSLRWELISVTVANVSQLAAVDTEMLMEPVGAIDRRQFLLGLASIDVVLGR